MSSLNRIVTLSLLTMLVASSAFASRNAGSDMLSLFSEEGSSLVRDAALRPVNYAQPPVGCVEEMVPHRASRPCLDLSEVQRPSSDWPYGISSEEKAYWWRERRGLHVCLSEEILRRERENAGSQSAFNVEMSWMAIDSLRNVETKIKAVYAGARAHNIPLQVLTGALYQESTFSELGIADDKGNFSCGMQQINIIGWCAYANKLSASEKAAMGWPQEAVTCTDTNLIQIELIRPIYDIARTRLRGLPLYRLRKEHFQKIPLDSVVSKWPASDRGTQEKRYELIQSFINNCSDARHGILAKANELATIYEIHVPAGFKVKDRYPPGQKFNRSCREEQVGDAYPLHTGWLMAVASYNGGPRAISAVTHYENWTREAVSVPDLVRNYTPNDVVKALYWGGKYNPQNDLIEFTDFNGTLRAWPFFKACVAQRHIARVMQHVTLTPEFFVDTLEGSASCVRGQFDSGGRLIRSGTPLVRQRSSGTR